MIIGTCLKPLLRRLYRAQNILSGQVSIFYKSSAGSHKVGSRIVMELNPLIPVCHPEREILPLRCAQGFGSLAQDDISNVGC